MKYEPTTFDVCISGMERLRNQNEFMLLAYLVPSTNAKSIREQWLDDMNGCDRFDGFEYDACRIAIDKAMAGWVRPAFRRRRWNPFGLSRTKRSEHGDGCIAFLYIRVPETGEEGFES